ncbi:hypothetical protein L596_004575 [Steinernema carpocapsae]|uniref:Uncharacterized protein n=1 Tax=Steinernema carpocapsae TaxID=34508 RepID=A0A4U8UXR2_STECR|nr:hypothetical protein L596_004575 [Steinernema carpocapsae]
MVSVAFYYALHIVGLAIATLADVPQHPPPPAAVEFWKLLNEKQLKLTSIQELNGIMQNFFATENSTTLDHWKRGLPTTEEKTEITALISDLLNADDFHDFNYFWLRKKYPTLTQSVVVTVFNKGRHAMVHESQMVGEKFARMWGYVLVTNKRFAKRPLHHSAAHFQSDGDVCNQAASVFEQTSSRTLVVAGASRFSVKGDNRSPCQSLYQVADAAHACYTMFQTMNLAVLASVNQMQDSNDHAFIQWHGMAETSCSHSPVFISAGARGDHPVYNSSTIPASKLVSRLNDHMGRIVAHTPRTDKVCRLIATSNIFGRAIYGVPADNVCNTRVNDQNVTGRFIHIEQKREFRDSWDVWADVVNAVF